MKVLTPDERKRKATLKALYPKSDGTEVILDAEMEKDAQDYLEYQRIKVEAEAQMDRAAMRLQEKMASSGSATVGDFLITWETQERKEYISPACSFRTFKVKKVS